MGHQTSCSDCSYLVFGESLPNKIGYLLSVGPKIESIIYYERYVVIQPGERTAGCK